jgi:hypothetical protein
MRGSCTISWLGKRPAQSENQALKDETTCLTTVLPLSLFLLFNSQGISHKCRILKKTHKLPCPKKDDTFRKSAASMTVCLAITCVNNALVQSYQPTSTLLWGDWGADMLRNKSSMCLPNNHRTPERQIKGTPKTVDLSSREKLTALHVVLQIQ